MISALTRSLQSDDFVAKKSLSERLISDHAAVICSLRTRRPVVELKKLNIES